MHSNKVGVELKVTKIQFAFDERNFPQDVGVPMGSKHGVVLMKFSDGTAISKSCVRRDLEETLAYCFNEKLNAPTQTLINTILNEVNEKVIGEDEGIVEDLEERVYTVPARNQLKATQRQALSKIREKYNDHPTI